MYVKNAFCLCLTPSNTCCKWYAYVLYLHQFLCGICVHVNLYELLFTYYVEIQVKVEDMPRSFEMMNSRQHTATHGNALPRYCTSLCIWGGFDS